MTDDEDPMVIPMSVFNGFLSYTAVTLNIIAILALRKTSSLPKPLKTLLLSLNLSDLGVGLLVQPLYLAYRFAEFRNNTFGILGKVYFIAGYILCFGSFLGVVALTVDRFLAVHLHLRYQELVTHKRIIAAVISVWVISAIMSLLNFLFKPNTILYTASSILFCVCLISAALLYSKIYLAVRRHIYLIQTRPLQEVQNGEVIANAARQRKSAIATFYVYLVFLVCYLPTTCINVATMTSNQSSSVKQIGNTFSLYFDTLVFLNSSLNPLIYCWKMRHIRHAVMEILLNIYPNHN